jgi:hypothetical protein
MSKNNTNENQNDNVLKPFAFPLFGFFCEAESLEQALTLLNNFINPPKKN